jgi:hypothetical protein
MRDIETIDSELRLLLAIRRAVREAEGRPPNTARMDALLDERSSLLPADTWREPHVWIVDRAAPALLGGDPSLRRRWPISERTRADR